MAHHDITTPVSEETIHSWRVNDTVTLNGTLFGIRDATQIHMFDRGRTTDFDLKGHAVIHTAPNVRKVEKSDEYPAGYAPVCIGTTTSSRMERFTRPLMEQYGVRMIIGKGGLLDDSSKAFAGQTFDRTVHKGDLTGIEIINRLAEQVWSRGIERMEEHRAVAIVPSKDGSGVSGVLMIDMRDGKFRFVQAKAVLMATGGGPTMYKYHTPSGDKSCDGMAMALRSGLTLRDMEMVQFHPTGLLAGDHTRMTGTVLEEGLRGAGGHLLNGQGKRFMENYDPRGERATRDIVSRGIYSEMSEGRTTPNGGVHIRMSHLGPDDVRVKFKGIVERCADCGFDLAGGLVKVVPTAHYMMGGVMFNPDCSTAMIGLFAAGEDTGGVHGANRLGGNGVANSTVIGGVAGDTMAEWVPSHGELRDPDTTVIDEVMADCLRPLERPQTDLTPIRESLFNIMWDKIGIMRNDADLKKGVLELDELAAQLDETGVGGDSRAYNVSWHDWMNLKNLIMVSRAIAAASVNRENSRGAHFREDYTDAGDLEASAFTRTRYVDGQFVMDMQKVQFTRIAPGQSLIND